MIIVGDQKGFTSLWEFAGLYMAFSVYCDIIKQAIHFFFGQG
jgi:hypothetical protein